MGPFHPSRPFFMPQQPPQGVKAKSVTDEFFRVRSELDLTEFYTRLEQEAITQLADLQQQGFKGRELADRVMAALNNLSDQPIETAARGATAEGFNLGRNLAAQELAPTGLAVRTSVLELDSTCKPCWDADDTVVGVNTPDYFRLMPPNLCKGRGLCRCFYLYRAAA